MDYMHKLFIQFLILFFMGEHIFSVHKTDEEWMKKLGSKRFGILRKADTEAAFSGVFEGHREDGVYTCGGCGNTLFTSQDKFYSGCGWPAFFRQFSKESIVEREDRSLGMVRTEVLCKNCGGHLGHWFPDGPQDSRYCINSAALDFIGAKK
jgi:peptide-methionine (R)-S-oxide reductase